MKKVLIRVPIQLLVLCGVFLIVPFWSMLFLGTPRWVITHHEVTQTTVIALAYWVGPVLMAITILSRSFLVLPFFLIECSALILHASSNELQLSEQMRLARLALIAVMGILGIIIINKDILYPFISGRKRFWRKAARYKGTSSELINFNDSSGKTYSARLEDCSLVGIGISSDNERTNQYLAICKPHDVVEVALIPNRKVRAEIVRTRTVDGTHYAGLLVRDVKAMETFLVGLPSPTGKFNFAHWISTHWASWAFRRVTMAVWVISAVGTLGIPCCGKSGGGGGSGTGFQPETPIGAVATSPQSVDCPVQEGFLCSNIPGIGSTPIDYCKLNRLSAIKKIPSRCPSGSCLLVTTTAENQPVILVATCWDMGTSKMTEALE